MENQYIIEDELTALLSLSEDRKNETSRRLNQREFLANEHAEFIHSLKFEQSRAQERAELEHQALQIEHFLDTFSSIPASLEHLEPTTPTGEEVIKTLKPTQINIGL